MPAEKWVAIWPDGRRVEIELSETTDGRFRADAMDDGDPWLAFGKMPQHAIAEVVRICGSQAYGFDPPAEILPAGEPPRAELLADLARLRAIEAAAERDSAAILRYLAECLRAYHGMEDDPGRALDTIHEQVGKACAATHRIRAALAGKGGA
jgi:hypothetical protein